MTARVGGGEGHGSRHQLASLGGQGRVRLDSLSAYMAASATVRSAAASVASSGKTATPTLAVARRVAEAVVGGLEIVGVDEEQGKAVALLLRLPDALRQLFVEGGAIGQFGQRVVRGAVCKHRAFAFHAALPALQFVEQRVEIGRASCRERG